MRAINERNADSTGRLGLTYTGVRMLTGFHVERGYVGQTVGKYATKSQSFQKVSYIPSCS